MALEKQNISISLKQGLDTKSDPKQVVAGKMLLLQNATFQSMGRLKKRAGFAVLSSTLSSGAAISAYNNELVVLDGAKVYSYGEQFKDLTSKGNKVACDISADSIVRNSYQQTHPDSITLNGIMCFGYSDSGGLALLTVMDQVTKKVYFTGANLGTSGSMVKASAIGKYILISFIEAGSPGTLRAFTYDTLSMTAGSITIAACNTSSSYYDVSKVGANLVYAYSGVASTLPSCSMVTVSPTLVLGTPLDFTTSATYQKCVFDDGTGQAVVGFNTLTAAQYIVCNAALTSFAAPVTIETIAGIQNITGIYDTTGPLFFYELLSSTGSTSDNYVRKCKLIAGFGTPADALRSVGLWSKPFKYGSSIYIVLTHDGKLQACYFITDQNGSVISRIATENGGGLSTNGVLREVSAVSANSFQFAYLIKDFVSSLNGNVFTQTGVNSLTLTFGGPVITQAIGNSLLLGGGVVGMYDGQTVVEKNFHFFPEGISAATSQAGGGLQTGSYQYSAVYEWMDNKGQIHQSAQSVPTKLDTAAAKLYSAGSTTSGSGGQFTPSVANYSDLNLIAPGMLITGSGIVAGSYTNYGPLFSAGAFTPSPASASSGTYILTTGKSFQGDSTQGSSAVTMTRQFQEYYPGNVVNGSTSITLNTDDQIRIGATVFIGSNGAVGQSGYIVVSQVGRIVTVSAPTPLTQSNMFLTARLAVNGNITAGSSVITGTSDTSNILVGDLLRYSLAGIQILVTAKTASTITVNYSFTSTVNTSFYVALPIKYPAVGEVFNDLSGSFPSATVKSIGVGTITLNSVATATTSAINFVSGSALAGNLTIPTLRVTDKAGVSIAVYRTLLNQTTFYRVSSLTVPVINLKTSDFISYVDTVSDGQLIGNEQLYTTGDVVENFPPPASSISWIYKNRLMLVPSEANKQIWFSKPAVPGVSVEFSDFFVLNVPDEGGPITAGAQLDDKNIIFKRSMIFAQVGDGPTNTGSQNDFSDPQRIAADGGCINQKSIVLIPGGLMFQSEKGIYLLDRSLNVSYIGKDVEAYNTSTISSAKLIKDLNQVRFSLAGSASTLVFDYTLGEWSVFNNPEVKDATSYKNLYTYIAPNGKLYAETPGVFVDDTLPVLQGWTTSWLSFAGLQGFQRIYKMLLLGEYKSPHSLTLNIAYDFKSTYNQTVSIPVPSAPSGQYQYRVNFSVQKCEAIQITLSEQQTTPYGEGMSLSAIALEVGAKKGLDKLSTSKSYG